MGKLDSGQRNGNVQTNVMESVKQYYRRVDPKFFTPQFHKIIN